MKREDREDDGRTIADMSMVERRNVFLPRRWKGQRLPPGEYGRSARPWEPAGFSREERRAALSGAMAAAVMIAGVFIAGGALLILFLQWIWHA